MQYESAIKCVTMRLEIMKNEYKANGWHTAMILSRLVDTFSSKILNPMQFLSGNYSIAVVLP